MVRDCIVNILPKIILPNKNINPDNKHFVVNG